MAGHFHTVIEEILKYDACVFRKFTGKYVCVQCENHFYASFCFLRIELRRRSDLFAVPAQDRLAGSFIHQDAGYFIVVSGHQVFISHRINYRRLSEYGADFIFCFPIMGIGTDLGIMDALVFILNVRVDSDKDLIVVKFLESDNGLSLQKRGVKSKGKFYGSRLLRRREGLFRTDLLSCSVFQRLPGLFIHKDT